MLVRRFAPDVNGYLTLSSILSSAFSKEDLSLKEKTERCKFPQMSLLFCPRSFSHLTRVNPRSLAHLLPSSTRHLRHVLPPPRPFHTSARRSFKTIEEARSRTRSGVIAPLPPLAPPTPLSPPALLICFAKYIYIYIALLVARGSSFSHRGRGDDILFST